MKRRSKISFGLLIGGVASVLGVVASTAGSLAWYVYARSARVSFVGTSIAKSALLNVGIVDNHLLDDKIDTYNLTRAEFDDKVIAFSKSTDGLDYHVIQDYLFQTDYAYNLLFPVTTGSRALDATGDLELYESPLKGDFNYNNRNQSADHIRYVVLPLAFRMTDTSGNNVANVDVWLTDVSVQASGENVDQALRLFIDNGQRKFLMKPADRTTSTGSTNVGGLLDLDGDETYDCDNAGREVYYGEHTGGDIPYSNVPYEIPENPEDYTYDNVNHVATVAKSTFCAKHAEGAYCADLTDIQPKTVEYQTFGTVKPSLDGDGKYCEGTTGIRIAKTNSDDAVGYVNLTIYIEGWDHSVIDEAAGHNFNLTLKFEVSRE